MMINDIRTKVLLDMVSRPTVQQSTVPNEDTKQTSETPAATIQTTDFPFKQMVTKLLQTIKNQQELLQSLPSELREVVEQIINDLQPQGELLPNMTTLVKTPKLVTQELINLAQQLKPEQLTPEKDLHTQLPGLPREILTQSPPIVQALANAIKQSPQLIKTELTRLALQMDISQLAPEQDSQTQLQALSQEVLIQSAPIIKTLANAIGNFASPEEEAALLRSLPTEVQDLIQQVLNETQPGKESLPLQNPQLIKTALTRLAQQMVSGQLAPRHDLQSQLQALPNEVLTQSAPIIKTLANAIGNFASPEEEATLLRSLPTKVQDLIQQVLSEMQPDTKSLSLKNPQLIKAELTRLALQMGSGQLPPQQDLQTQLQTLSKEVLTQSATLVRALANAIGNTVSPEEQATLLRSLPIEVQALIQQLLNRVQPGKERLSLKTAVMGDTPTLATNELTQTTSLPGRVDIKMAEQLNLIKDLPEKVLQQSAETIRKIAALVSTYEPLTGTINPKGETIATFAMPIYFDPGQPPYPAYIHIYHQEEQEENNEGQSSQKDTWIRVSIGTENMGIVDIMFHLYGDQQLDIKVKFSVQEAAELFSNYVSDIKDNLSESPLEVKSFNIIG